MSQPRPKRDTGRRAGLTTEGVASTALHIVDTEGLDSLTMRRIARELAVTPMAIYNHVPNRSGLEQLIVDTIIQIDPPPAHWSDPRVVLTEIAHELRRTYLAHPNALPLLQTVATSSGSSLMLIESGLSALVAHGVSIEGARTVWIGLMALVNGHVAHQLQGHFSDPANADRLPETLTTLRRAVAAGATDYAAAFDQALFAYVAGALAIESVS